MSPRDSTIGSIIACCLFTLVLLATPGSTKAADSTGGRTIYRCHIDGVLTFSDHVCGSSAQHYEGDDSRVSTYTAPAAARPDTSGAAARSPKAPKTAARKPAETVARSSATKEAVECQRIENSLREIRSKERSGYTAKEGERLRARREKIEQRRLLQGC